VRFWDTSAIVPLLLAEPTTAEMEDLLRLDADIAVWWATWTECGSAIARRGTEGLTALEQRQSRTRLERLEQRWSEVQPSQRVRSVGDRLLVAYAPLHLRAADGLQLAAALRWCSDAPDGREFVCRDNRLRQAAGAEGFTVRP